MPQNSVQSHIFLCSSVNLKYRTVIATVTLMTMFDFSCGNTTLVAHGKILVATTIFLQQLCEFQINIFYFPWGLQRNNGGNHQSGKNFHQLLKNHSDQGEETFIKLCRYFGIGVLFYAHSQFINTFQHFFFIICFTNKSKNMFSVT